MGSKIAILAVGLFLVSVVDLFSAKVLILWRLAWVLLATAFVADTLLNNTAIAFVSRRPVDPLRSAVLTVITVGQIALAFSVMFGALREGFSPPLTGLDPLYFSFVTITTLGPGDIKPVNAWVGQIAKAVVILELWVGLYFLAVVVGTIVTWANVNVLEAEPERREFQFPDNSQR